MTTADVEVASFSPVENEAPLRWWRRLGLAGAGELGVYRRAALFALVCWLPIVGWALATGRLRGAGADQSLLAHYSIHVRCLIAIPLLIVAEEALHRGARAIAGHFVSSGLVTPALRPEFDAVMRGIARLRDNALPWAFAIGAAIAWAIADPPRADLEELNWSVGADGSIGFGGTWYAYVARPILAALILGWLWRLLLVSCWMWRVTRLPLSFVPTHPDRVAGLGFVKRLPAGFTLVTLALSATMASRFAHDVVYHDAPLSSFQLPVIAYAVLWSLALMLPLFAIAPALRATRDRAHSAYSALVGEQGRLVHRRWIEGRPVDDVPLLDAPEIGPVADAAALYESVHNMQVVPIGKRTLTTILLPMTLPFLVLPLLKYPLDAIMSALLKALL
jgi:hypothetical protein